MKKPKRFRVATSGPTIDGREIKPEWLQQAADNYDPALYAARINVEHLRGFSANSDFGAFGDVVALTAQTNKAGKVELLADIVLNEKGQAANKAGQKLYTSVELVENFAGTGSAYLVGLALTDSPASLGTQRLEFSAQPEDATYTAKCFTPLGNKAHALAFGMAHSITIPADEPAAGDVAAEIKNGFAKMLEKLTNLASRQDKPAAPAAASDAGTTTPAAPDVQLAQAVIDELQKLAQPLVDVYAMAQAAAQAAQAQSDKLAADLAALKTQLEKTPATYGRRPLSDGGQQAAANLAEF